MTEPEHGCNPWDYRCRLTWTVVVAGEEHIVQIARNLDILWAVLQAQGTGEYIGEPANFITYDDAEAHAEHLVRELEHLAALLSTEPAR